MNVENKYPELIIIKGIGLFSNGEIEFESSFEMIHYPQKTTINSKFDSNINPFELLTPTNSSWMLNGKTENGHSISASSLFFTTLKPGEICFQPSRELIIGEPDKNDFQYAQFPLVGYYKGAINFKVNGWNITNKLDNAFSDVQFAKAKYWGIQLEGLILNIEKSNSTTSDFHDTANDVCLLLSLATGNDVTFNRQLFYKEDRLLLEIWKRKTGYEFGVEQCISDLDINEFLSISIANFVKWPKEKKDTFYSVVNYINSSSRGHMEDRLLRLCIAWESLANRWAIEKDIKNEDLGRLKEQLKKLITEFDVPITYDKGFIINRVIQSLDWEKLNLTLMQLLHQYGLDAEKLGLDFKTLISIRNDVAHSGQLRREYSKEYLADILFKNKQGLQVLLLRELGYRKRIQTTENNWSAITYMDEYTQNTPPST